MKNLNDLWTSNQEEGVVGAAVMEQVEGMEGVVDKEVLMEMVGISRTFAVFG